jgi:hypothetical protein
MKKLFSLGAVPKLRLSRAGIFAVAGLIVSAAVLSFRLGSSPAHLATDERAGQSAASLHAIFNNPLNAPFKIIEWLGLQTFGYGATGTRLASVVFALIAVSLFFIATLRWHGWRTAWLTTILFASSGWLLHTGRIGVPNILWFLLPLVLISFSLWLEKTKRHALALFGAALIFGLALFVPAAIWFLLVCAVLGWPAIREHFSWLSKQEQITVGVILLVFVGVLTFSLFRSPDLLRPWLGLPHTLPSVKVALKTWVESFTLYPFIRGPQNAEIWLGRTPIFDAFTSALTLIGAWFYARHLTNHRAQILLAFIALGTILTALNGAAGMNFLVPIAYLLAATGLTFTLHKWLRVFPRNPIARLAGVALIGLAITFAASYHLTEYFVAWPHNPNTTATFR